MLDIREYVVGTFERVDVEERVEPSVLEYIEDGSRLCGNIAWEDGSLPDESMMVYGIPREALR